MEYLGFHFNGRWRRLTEKAVKKFKAEIKHRTRRQQSKNLETVIASINPVIRGCGNYFKEGTVKKIKLAFSLKSISFSTQSILVKNILVFYHLYYRITDKFIIFFNKTFISGKENV